MIRKLVATLLVAVSFSLGAFAQRLNTAELDRGLVAIKTDDGVFCSWRINGSEYYDVQYNIYRDGTKLNSKPLDVSNFVDKNGSVSSSYTVRAVVRGVEMDDSKAVTPWTTDYMEITPDHGQLTSVYEPNDATVADVDGDGELELIIKFRNVTDANAGYPVDSKEADIIECYKLDGTKLWWIDAGPNMVDFQSNELNIAAYDWDGDGKAECILRGADGMTLHTAKGNTIVVGDATVNTRNIIVRDEYGHSTTATFTFSGAEYLLYLDGETAEPYWTPIVYPLPRLEKGETDLKDAWGDGYGHRSSKHFFGAPYFDGERPSIFLARGIYTRHKMIAYDVDPSTHQLTTRWRWNSTTLGPWYGQGYHNYSVADVDWDGRDEIVFGSMVIDDNGRGLSTTGLGHGDAQHVGDFNPYVHGSEIFACNEDNPDNNYRDATTSKIYYRKLSGRDDGRSICGNFSNDYLGALGYSGHDVPVNCVSNQHIGIDGTGVSLNFRIYWDGDLCEETMDGAENGPANIYKLGSWSPIKTFTGTQLNNSTKTTPCLSADIFGDWREEVVLRTPSNSIRIYTTTFSTKWRNYTLMDDHQYRNAIIWQMNGYNQPPHASYFLGELENITVAPPPLIMNGRVSIPDGATLTPGMNDKHLVFSPTKDASFSVPEDCSPYIMTINTPSWVQGTQNNDGIIYDYYTHTITGHAFTGNMRLVKQGDGTLSLPDVEQTYTGETSVWAGTLSFDGTMTNSPVWLNRFATLNSKGIFKRKVTALYDATIAPAGNEKGVVTIDTLVLDFGAKLQVDLYADDLSSDEIVSKELTITKFAPAEGYLPYTGPVVSVTPHLADGDEFLKPGRYKIATIEAVKGSIDDISVVGLPGLKTKLTYSDEDKSLYLEVADMRQPKKLFWVGRESDTWDFADTYNFVDEHGVIETFVSGDTVVFGQKSLTNTIVVRDNLKPGKIVFVPMSEQQFTLSGDNLIGDAKLYVTGAGSVKISNTNSLTGGVYINGGRLIVGQLAYTDGSELGALGYSSNTINISGGTLETEGSVYCSHKITLAGADTICIPAGSSLLLTEGIETPDNNTEWIKIGAGQLTLSNNPNGGTLRLREGTVRGGETGASRLTGPYKIIYEGGTFSELDNIFGNPSYCATNMEVVKGMTGTYSVDSRSNVTGTLTGDGTLNVVSHNVRTYIQGNWSSFSGTLKLTGTKTGQYDPMLFFTNGEGMPLATIDNGNVWDNNGASYRLGKISGSGTFSGGGTYSIGVDDENFSFGGTLTGCGINKVGTGAMTLTKVQADVKSVSVSEGVLNLKPMTITTNFFGDKTLMVEKGGTLMGRAQVNGIEVKEGGILYPGDYRAEKNVGYLKATNITINEGGEFRSTLVDDKQAVTSLSSLKVTLFFTMNGTVRVFLDESYQPKVGDTFVLWDATSARFGNKVVVSLPELPEGMTWNTDNLLTKKGTIVVESTTTAVHDVVNEKSADNTIYNLAGQKMNPANLKKGLYIKNGKAFLVK
ncbi:MAG: autotransporter-associated beta strand repeat-containing protein [Bacteroidales bacterium]|nr:autotransporter-associated beta strand repeat-containing protein [Bacteroidales bacterium]